MNEIQTARSTVRGQAEELEALRREVERLRALTSADAPVLLATLVRHSPHGILVCDVDGKLTLHNEAAERIWGGSATTLSMHDWSAYKAFHEDGSPYGADDWAMVRCLRDRAIVAAEEVHIQRFDGTHALLLGSCAPILGPKGDVRGALSVFADITAFAELGAAERASRERTAKLQAVTAALSEARLPRDIAQVVSVHMAAVVGAQRAAIATALPDGAELELLGHAGLGPTSAGELARFPPDAEIPIARAFATAAPVWLESTEAIRGRFPTTDRLADGSLCAVAAAPLVIGQTKLGAIAFGFEKTRVFDDADRALIQDLATQTALALDRARLYEAEQVARRRNEALARVSRRFAEAGLDRVSLLAEITDAIGGALDACVAICLLDEDGELRLGAVYHPSPDAREVVRKARDEGIPLLGGFAGAVARSGVSLLVPHIAPAEFAASLPSVYRPYVERFPITAYLCSALRARGGIIGTVSLGKTRGGETFTEDDRAYVEELADRAATAIENARLYEEDVRARTRAEQLYRFAQRAVRTDRIEEVFEAALDAIAHALGSDRASILVSDKEGVMRFRAWRGLSEQYRRAAEGHSPWAADVTSPEPVLVPDALADPSLASLAPVFREERIGALAFIPLVTGGRLIGKFMVYHADRRVFTAREVDLAMAIANHLASVIDRFAAVADLRETLHYNELFAGVLAHDLRNPLGAMMSAAQLLLRRQEGEGARVTKPLNRIVSAGDRMARMIEQLLDLTRIRVGGGIEIRPREANLAELCGQALDELELAHPEWAVERRQRGSLDGVWDADRILQIVSNLVGNAGQHGAPGRPIRVTLDGTAPDVVLLEVQNDGTIPDALMASLFDPFGAARQARDGARGLGLGLFIVRELVNAHRGRLEVSSNGHAGTTFSVRLPRVSPPSLETAARP